MVRSWDWLGTLLFPSDSGHWVTVLRTGLGLQIVLYAWSLRPDWTSLFSRGRTGLVNRALAEAVLSGESPFTPRIGWFIRIGQTLGLTEVTILWILWLTLVVLGFFLIAGFCYRGVAIAGWFVFLSVAKSGTLFSYGVDNLTVIGLFYLMIAPRPPGSPWSSGRKRRTAIDPQRYGFHRRILQLHLSIIYFFAGISKALGPEWWNGVSVWKALTRPPFDLIAPDVLIRFAPLFPIAGIAGDEAYAIVREYLLRSDDRSGSGGLQSRALVPFVVREVVSARSDVEKVARHRSLRTDGRSFVDRSS